MPRISCKSCKPAVLGLVAVVMLNACGRSPAPQATAPAPVASTGALSGHDVSTKRYRIAIDYPPLSPEADALTRALHQRSAEARHQFMQALPDPGQRPEVANRQMQLLIRYKVASRTQAFISVREQGMMNTGGAHPLPLDGTFVFDRRTDSSALSASIAAPGGTDYRLEHQLQSIGSMLQGDV